jgi:hypothetical protein
MIPTFFPTHINTIQNVSVKKTEVKLNRTRIYPLEMVQEIVLVSSYQLNKRILEISTVLGKKFALSVIKMGIAYAIKDFDFGVSDKTSIPLIFDPASIFVQEKHIQGGPDITCQKKSSNR